MGTKCVPTYANIFMAIFEDQKFHIKIFHIKYFISKINEVHSFIKFDFDYSKTQIHILDIIKKHPQENF